MGRTFSEYYISEIQKTYNRIREAEANGTDIELSDWELYIVRDMEQLQASLPTINGAIIASIILFVIILMQFIF